MSVLATIGAAIGAIANVSKAVPAALAWWRGRSSPQARVEINVVAAPIADIDINYSVHVQAFLRLRVLNRVGQEARLEDPYLLLRELLPLGRGGRVLCKLPLTNNTDGTRLALHEIVPPYTDGSWHQDLYFHATWVPQPLKLKARQPYYPRETELVLCARILVPHRGPVPIARWRHQLWNWPNPNVDTVGEVGAGLFRSSCRRE